MIGEGIEVGKGVEEGEGRRGEIEIRVRVRVRGWRGIGGDFFEETAAADGADEVIGV